ncbi:MAG: MqnA/MqnD/SBP family protein [Candidatus Micrarchaeia archaeon]
MRRIIAVWIIMVILSAFSLYHDEPAVDLRIGSIKAVDTIHPFVAEDLGYFSDEGLSVRILSFGTSPALAEAMASGEIDAAYMSIIPTAVWKERGSDILIISGASRGGDVVCASGDEPRRIAVSGKGTMTETLFRGYVGRKLDIKPIYGIEPADMPTAMLVTKDVDAALTWQPFADAISGGGGDCFMDVGEEWKRDYGSRYQRNVLVVSRRIAEDPGLMGKLLRVHKRAVGFLNSPPSGAEISKVMKVAPMKRMYAEYNDSLDWPSMERLWGMAVDSGYLKAAPRKDTIYHGG